MQVPALQVEEAKPLKESPLEFGDKDVPMAEAALPEDDKELKDLGLDAGGGSGGGGSSSSSSSSSSNAGSSRDSSSIKSMASYGMAERWVI